ncbi:bifunctional DNA primase/polymerase [uncultured Methylobacterium sp.]|uniref:bifunctional DNA primase/polymerase n=1 Tax=uncultured Methylobacterium sp. TaxID=157278 RepID=UPI0026091185|nr:bifunctional DNA primase/polymerase [uncultured Methylobacterium sp.]
MSDTRTDDPFIRAVLNAMPGWTIVQKPAASAPAPALPAIEGLHQINAPMFGALAPDLVRLGWSVFPQNRDDRRGPGKIDGVPLSWKPYSTRLPTQDEISWWSNFCPSHNVAVIFGQASGNTFALDVDVDDVDLSKSIQALADEHLGYTPLRRIGRFPRIVLVYRQAPAAELRSDEMIRTRRFAFAKDGNADPGAVEILAQGSPVTSYGLHHKTGRYFLWPDNDPLRLPPSAAPLVSAEQLDAFLDAVNDLRPFSRKARADAAGSTWSFDPAAGLHVPADLGPADWSEAGGKVVDSREAFLWRLVQHAVRANEAAARDAASGRAQLCGLVESQFRDRAELGGRWTAEYLRIEIAAKVRASAEWHAENDRFARLSPGSVVALGPDGRVERAPSRDEDAPEPVRAPALGHLKKGWVRDKKRDKRRRLLAGPDPVRAMERALIEDEALRLDAAQAASEKVRGHEREWIGSLYDRAAERRRQEKRGKTEIALDAGDIRILKGPAGVGKTSSFWRVLSNLVKSRGKIGYPIGFAMPSHLNIEDSLAGAVEAGLAWEKNVAEVAAQGERHGLKVIVFRGKLRTNCGFKEQIRALQGASINTEKLCASRRQTNADMPGAKPDYEAVRCPMFDACEYQRSIAELATADVVLFASAYLAVTPPAALTKALIGLVVDERPYSGLIGSNSRNPMPLAILETPRAAPRLTPEELAPLLIQAQPREAIEARKTSYLAERAGAVQIVLPHLKKGDIGAAINSLHLTRDGNRRIGLELVESAYTVCARGADLAKDVGPGMTEEAASALAGMPQGGGLWDERRFWSLLRDRLQAMRDDEENPIARRRARGAWDTRLQVVTIPENALGVRMSWRVEPSFPGLPLLFLDASAAPAIVTKLWAERAIDTLEVAAPNHAYHVLVTGSTFSDRSMLPSRASRSSDLKRTAESVALYREVIARLSGVHGYGKVLVGGNKGVMATLRGRWKPPLNVDFVHNGGMRGLDFAKNHAAAVLFGRLELPVRALDAIVAALTYDDDEPELPIDRFGNGLDADGKPLCPPVGEKVVQMRDGSDLAIQDVVYEGAWAKLVQQQWREEEVRQFAARLRPVHRVGEAPVIYLACAAIPEGMIIDDTIDVADLASGTPSAARPWEAARQTGGLLSADHGWQARPDLALDAEAFANTIAHAKGDVVGHPESRGTLRIRWRIGQGSGEWKTANVLAYSADPIAPLRQQVAAEGGYTEEELESLLDWEILWEGTPRQPSGTRAPDAIDLANTGLPAGATREEVLRVLADQEAADREAMMSRIRSELSGLPEGADPAAIDAALKARRIEFIDWKRLQAFPWSSRKNGTVTLATKILMSPYAGDIEEDEDA